MASSKHRVLAILTDRNVKLPDDGLTLAKIRSRGTHFHVEKNEFLSFRLERHPTMYLSDSLSGRQQSPARFHVLTAYRLMFDTETWRVEELDSTFDFDPYFVIQAELDTLGIQHAIEEEVEAVKLADNPEAAFDAAFASWIDLWEDKFAEVDGRPVPDDKQDEIIQLLVDELRSRAGIE
jgi:hypothetical protein